VRSLLGRHWRHVTQIAASGTAIETDPGKAWQTWGLTEPRRFAVLTDEPWESELALNLLAAVRLDRALVPA
jgi:hypothetical protein